MSARARELFEGATKVLGEAVRAQAVEYLEHLGRVSETTLREGEKVLAELVVVANKLAVGAIDEGTAANAAKNLLRALGNIAEEAENAEKAEEVRQARLALETLSRFALALVSAGVAIAVPAAAAFLDGLSARISRPS